MNTREPELDLTGPEETRTETDVKDRRRSPICFEVSGRRWRRSGRLLVPPSETRRTSDPVGTSGPDLVPVTRRECLGMGRGLLTDPEGEGHRRGFASCGTGRSRGIRVDGLTTKGVRRVLDAINSRSPTENGGIVSRWSGLPFRSRQARVWSGPTPRLTGTTPVTPTESP